MVVRNCVLPDGETEVQMSQLILDNKEKIFRSVLWVYRVEFSDNQVHWGVVCPLHFIVLLSKESSVREEFLTS